MVGYINKWIHSTYIFTSIESHVFSILRNSLSWFNFFKFSSWATFSSAFKNLYPSLIASQKTEWSLNNSNNSFSLSMTSSWFHASFIFNLSREYFDHQKSCSPYDLQFFHKDSME